MASACRIKRGNSYKAVYARLTFHKAVGIFALYEDTCRFETCLVAVKEIKRSNLKAVTLAPSAVHSEKHLRPILRLRSACAGVEGKNCIFGIIFTAQKSCKGHGVKITFKLFYALGALIEHTLVLFFI